MNEPPPENVWPPPPTTAPPERPVAPRVRLTPVLAGLVCGALLAASAWVLKPVTAGMFLLLWAFQPVYYGRGQRFRLTSRAAHLWWTGYALSLAGMVAIIAGGTHPLLRELGAVVTVLGTAMVFGTRSLAPDARNGNDKKGTDDDGL